MNFLLTWLSARVVEPSTWAGAAIMINGIVHGATSGDISSIAQAIGGFIAVIAPEQSGK